MVLLVVVVLDPRDSYAGLAFVQDERLAGMIVVEFAQPAWQARRCGASMCRPGARQGRATVGWLCVSREPHGKAGLADLEILAAALIHVLQQLQ